MLYGIEVNGRRKRENYSKTLTLPVLPSNQRCFYLFVGGQWGSPSAAFQSTKKLNSESLPSVSTQMYITEHSQNPNYIFILNRAIVAHSQVVPTCCIPDDHMNCPLEWQDTVYRLSLKIGVRL